MKTRTFRYFIIAGLLLLLSACSRTPELPPLAKDANIVAFGDELTLAAHLSTEQSLTGLLQKHLQRTVINAGVAGESLEQAAQRLPKVLDAEKPALLILMHGGYRLDKDEAVAQIIDLFRNMINTAQQRKVQVLLIGMPENGPYLAPPKFYRQLGSTFKLPYHGGVLSQILATPAFLSPNGLPNEQGYQKLADSIIQLLQETKAIPTPKQ